MPRDHAASGMELSALMTAQRRSVHLCRACGGDTKHAGCRCHTALVHQCDMQVPQHQELPLSKTTNGLQCWGVKCGASIIAQHAVPSTRVAEQAACESGPLTACGQHEQGCLPRLSVLLVVWRPAGKHNPRSNCSGPPCRCRSRRLEQHQPARHGWGLHARDVLGEHASKPRGDKATRKKGRAQQTWLVPFLQPQHLGGQCHGRVLHGVDCERRRVRKVHSDTHTHTPTHAHVRTHAHTRTHTRACHRSVIS